MRARGGLSWVRRRIAEQVLGRCKKTQVARIRLRKEGVEGIWVVGRSICRLAAGVRGGVVVIDRGVVSRAGSGGRRSRRVQVREVGVRFLGSPGSIFLSGYCCLWYCCVGIQSRKKEMPWVGGKNPFSSLEDGMRERMMMAERWKQRQSQKRQLPKKRPKAEGTGVVDDLAKVGPARCDSAQFLGQPAEPQAKSLRLPSVNKAVSRSIPNPGDSALASACNTPVCTHRRLCLVSSGRRQSPAPSLAQAEHRAPRVLHRFNGCTADHDCSRLANGKRPRSQRSRCPVAKDVPVNAQGGSWMSSTAAHISPTKQSMHEAIH